MESHGIGHEPEFVEIVAGNPASAPLIPIDDNLAVERFLYDDLVRRHRVGRAPGAGSCAWIASAQTLFRQVAVA